MKRYLTIRRINIGNVVTISENGRSEILSEPTLCSDGDNWIVIPAITDRSIVRAPFKGLTASVIHIGLGIILRESADGAPWHTGGLHIMPSSTFASGSYSKKLICASKCRWVAKAANRLPRWLLMLNVVNASSL